jgi:hypothetical protein
MARVARKPISERLSVQFNLDERALGSHQSFADQSGRAASLSADAVTANHVTAGIDLS